MNNFWYIDNKGKVWNCRGFIRGGNWNNGANAGAFTLNLNNAPSNVNTNIGFRCASDREAFYARMRDKYLRIFVQDLKDHRTFSVPILSRKHKTCILVGTIVASKLNGIHRSQGMSKGGLASL